MMTAQEGHDFGHEETILDPSTSDESPFIADATELERFASESSSGPISPEIKGVIAEVALSGLLRYPWQLLSPILHRLLDAALDSFSSTDLAEDEAGPPRPMPDGGTLEDARASLHSLLNDFSGEAPFTIQRLCEIVLEPSKQYSKIEKFILAVERLLLVTSTVGATPLETLPPRPRLSSLGPVNENRPSPYDGEPPAGPQPSIEDRLQPMGNVILDSDEYAIFVGAETGQPTGELVAMDGHGAGIVAVGSPLSERVPTPMEPAEVIQAEAFVHAALGTSSLGGVGGGGGEEDPIAAAVAAAVASAVVQPVIDAAAAAAAAAAAEKQQPQQQEEVEKEPETVQIIQQDVVMGQPMENAATKDDAVAHDAPLGDSTAAAAFMGGTEEKTSTSQENIPQAAIEEPKMVPAADPSPPRP